MPTYEYANEVAGGRVYRVNGGRLAGQEVLVVGGSGVKSAVVRTLDGDSEILLVRLLEPVPGEGVQFPAARATATEGLADLASALPALLERAAGADAPDRRVACAALEAWGQRLLGASTRLAWLNGR